MALTETLVSHGGSRGVTDVLVQKMNAFPLLGGGAIRLVVKKYVWVQEPHEDRFRIYKVSEHRDTILRWAWTLYHTQFLFLYPTMLKRFADSMEMNEEEAEELLKKLNGEVCQMPDPVW